MTQFAASSGHLAALLKPIAMAASGTLPDGRGFASAPSDAAGAVMVPLALQPTRAESGPGTAGAADVFHRPAASGQWSSGVGHPSVSQLRAAAAESQARLHLQRRALVARSDHTASSPEGSPSETVQGQRRSAAATDAAGAPDKSAVGKRAMAASTPRRAAPTAHQSLASSGAGTGAGLPWPPAGTGSSCHSEQPSEEGRQELGSDGNGSPQSPPTTKRARRSSTGKIVLGASEDRQQQLRHLGYRIAGGVESLAPALAKLNKLTPGESTEKAEREEKEGWKEKEKGILDDPRRRRKKEKKEKEAQRPRVGPCSRTSADGHCSWRAWCLGGGERMDACWHQASAPAAGFCMAASGVVRVMYPLPVSPH